MSSTSLPTVTIITPSYNQRQFLPSALASIRGQDYAHIEHIIIDGGSTDDTLEFLASHAAPSTWISEPDRGQAHAINKGMAMAHGEIVGWLNCDDRYVPGAIRTVVEVFAANPDAMLIYGDAMAIDGGGRRFGLRVNVRPCTVQSLVERGDAIVQPAAFWRRTLHDEIGPLDDSLHYMMDYEFWMRAALRRRLLYVPVCLAEERIHQAAKTSTGHLRRIHELYVVATRHGGRGVPREFRAEAAALYFWEAASSWRRGQRDAARDQFRIGVSLRPWSIKFVMYVCGVFLFRPHSIARMRLIANRLRSWRRPRMPKDFRR